MRTLLLLILGVGFICTAISAVTSIVKNGFEAYDLDNVRRMCIAIGIVVISLILPLEVPLHWFVSAIVVIYNCFCRQDDDSWM